VASKADAEPEFYSDLQQILRQLPLKMLPPKLPLDEWITKFNVRDDWLVRTAEHTVLTWWEQIPRPGAPEAVRAYKCGCLVKRETDDEILPEHCPNHVGMPAIPHPDGQWHLPPVLMRNAIADPPVLSLVPWPSESVREFQNRARGELERYIDDWADTIGGAPTDKMEEYYRLLAKWQANHLAWGTSRKGTVTRRWDKDKAASPRTGESMYTQMRRAARDIGLTMRPRRGRSPAPQK
jgi:hypothetical protein